MAFNMAAIARSAVVLMLAVLFVATQMETQGVFAARLADDMAAAPSPADMEPGAAGAMLPSIVGPTLMAVFSFLALKHL